MIEYLYLSIFILISFIISLINRIKYLECKITLIFEITKISIVFMSIIYIKFATLTIRNL